MKVTAITCTYQRPEAFALCEKYLKRQTRQPDQWLVLDGPEAMRQKVRDCIERIEGDIVVFVEDDDHYRPDWIESCVAKVEEGYDLVGEGLAVYYHVGHRWWSECRNVRHAALCQTAISRLMLEPLYNVIDCFDSPFFDTRLWQLECNKHLALPNSSKDRRVIGIKGMPGKQGYSTEHGQIMPRGVNADPSLLKLWRWIGQDAEVYSPFKR